MQRISETVQCSATNGASIAYSLSKLRDHHKRGVIRQYEPEVGEDGREQCLLGMAVPKHP